METYIGAGVELSPGSLRQRYGDKIGNEISTLRLLIKSDIAIRELLTSLDNMSDEMRNDLMCVIWQQYYISVANSIVNFNRKGND